MSVLTLLVPSSFAYFFCRHWPASFVLPFYFVNSCFGPPFSFLFARALRSRPVLKHHGLTLKSCFARTRTYIHHVHISIAWVVVHTNLIDPWLEINRRPREFFVAELRAGIGS